VLAEEGVDAVADAEATIMSTLNMWGCISNVFCKAPYDRYISNLIDM
jgi:hypothetical protein